MKGYEALALALYAEGVDVVFGIPGGAIQERDESNNRAELHAFTVTGATPSLRGLGEPLPARPLPGAAAGPR